MPGAYINELLQSKKLFFEGETIMCDFIKKIIETANQYTLWDYFCLKTTLLSLGILIGTYFSDFLTNYTFFLWAIFLVAYVSIMYRTFFKLMQ